LSHVISKQLLTFYWKDIRETVKESSQIYLGIS